MTHPIAQPLYKIQAITGDSFFKLYDDWLALMVAALAKEETDYMSIMKTYGSRIEGKTHPADYFAEAMSLLMQHAAKESSINRSFPDYLGQIYEEESVFNKHMGQFFTPESVCKMMAHMTVDKTEESISISDPACGSGRTLIAAMPLAPKARFTAVDKDYTCVLMCSVNMLLRNANAAVIHANTLTLETFGGYRCLSTPVGGHIYKLTPEQAKQYLVIQAQQPTIVAANPEKQKEIEKAVQEYAVNERGQYDLGL